MRIFLVRHAQPQVSPAADPRDWPLSGPGRSAARYLRGRLPVAGLWVASTEVKAFETLSCAKPDEAIVITTDERFDEVNRLEPFDGDVTARRRAWVDDRLDERHSGWETPLEAAERFEAAVRDHSALGSPLVIGSHGMVLTAWLVHVRGAVNRQAAGAFWEAMAFPYVTELSNG